MTNGQRNFRIVETIASGGTAVIYKAIQTSLDRPVVIKRLHPFLTNDEQFTSRFEMEAKAAASLDHENIVRIIDFGSTHGEHYIVMEYIEGLSIEEIAGRRGPLEPDLALLLAREICLGLDHAHQRGIVHRDVKPANIMVSRDGIVKITDFGLAKLRLSQTNRTASSTLLGTPLYMSPEQATGGAIDGRSDIFSLGTVLYELLTGVQPFVADNYAAVISRIAGETPRRPSDVDARVNEEAGEIVMTAFAREPGRRYRTALEMARAIERVVGPEALSGSRERLRRLVTGWREPGSDRIDDRRGSKRRKSGFGSFAPTAIAACIVIAAGYFLLNDPGRLAALRERIAALRSPGPAEAVPELLVAGPEFAIPATPIAPPGDAVAADTLAAPDTLRAAEPPAIEPAAELTAPESGPAEEETEQEPPAPDPAPALRAPAPTPTGFLGVAVDEPASIVVDGEIVARGHRLDSFELPAGRHELVCRADGFREYRETIHVTRGELSRRFIELVPIAGRIAIDTAPNVRVYVDGIIAGTTPLAAAIELPAGAHHVELRKSGFLTWSQRVIVPADGILRLPIRLVPETD